MQRAQPEELAWLKQPREDFPLGLIRANDPIAVVPIAIEQLREYGYLNADQYSRVREPQALSMGGILDTLSEFCPPYVRLGGLREDDDAIGFWVMWERFDADRESGRIPTYINKTPPDDLTGLAAWIGPAGDLRLYQGRPTHELPFIAWEIL